MLSALFSLQRNDYLQYDMTSGGKAMTKKVRMLKEEILSDNWYTLKKLTFEIQQKDGSWVKQEGIL